MQTKMCSQKALDVALTHNATYLNMGERGKPAQVHVFNFVCSIPFLFTCAHDEHAETTKKKGKRKVSSFPPTRHVLCMCYNEGNRLCLQF